MASDDSHDKGYFQPETERIGRRGRGRRGIGRRGEEGGTESKGEEGNSRSRGRGRGRGWSRGARGRREELYEEGGEVGSGEERRSGERRGGARGRRGARGRSTRGRGEGRSEAVRCDHGNSDFTSADQLEELFGRKRGELDKDKSWYESVRCLSLHEIMTLSYLPPQQLLEKLSSKIKGFQCTLQRRKTLERPGIVYAILTILSKIADSIKHDDSNKGTWRQILGEALSDRGVIFQLQLKMYVSNELGRSRHSAYKPGSPENEIDLVVDLFHKLLLYLPKSSYSCLPVDELKQSIEQLPIDVSFLDSLETIVSLRDSIRREQCSKQPKQNQEDVETLWDNSEYKTIEILPHWNEICGNIKPRLRKNITSGGYKDWLHYYDVQFRLLREDFIAPLRSGVCEYLGGVRGRKLKNIRVYNNVLIKEPQLLSVGLCYKIQLDFSHIRRHINWEHSKRLLHGSLLCLSPKDDGFNTQMYFATVFKRDPKEIARGELVVMFQKDDIMLSFSCRDRPFTMVESCAYFEASQHILRSLQTAEVETMPFTKYLVEGECTSVDQPKYLKNSQSAYDLTCLLPEDNLSGLGSQVSVESVSGSLFVSDDNSSGSDESGLSSNSDGIVLASSNESKLKQLLMLPHASNRGLNVRHIEDFNCWPSSKETELDNSQLQGLQMALTQEIAVIQGPPGTGKTYIGLKIVEALLMNSNIWNSGDVAKSPIFVMCLTNHALDQFLEGILDSPFYKEKPNRAIKLVRIGGRCQSERLSEFNLNSKRGDTFLPQGVFYEKRDAEQAVRDCATEVERLYERYFSQMRSCTTVSLMELESCIHPDHYYSLCRAAKTPKEQEYALELWLGLVQVASFPPTKQAINVETNEKRSEDSSEKQSEDLLESSEEESEISFEGSEEESESSCEGTSEEESESSFEGSEEESYYSDSNSSEACQDFTMDYFSKSSRDERELQLLVTQSQILEQKSAEVHNVAELAGRQANEDEESKKIGVLSNDAVSNSESFIDIEGEAMIEQSRRLLDDTDRQQSLVVDHNVAGKDFLQRMMPASTDTCPSHIDVVHPRQQFPELIFDQDRVNRLLQFGFSVQPMSKEESIDVKNIHNLSETDRWRLYQYWHSQYLSHLHEKCEEAFVEYNKLCSVQDEARKKADRFSLESAQIIGMTTTGAAKYQHILHLVKPRIAIVEEAAEVLESHIVSALNAGTQHLILIGDHKQLRPKPNEYELAKKYNLDISLFERLIRNGFPHATLEFQHRMRPEIAQLVKPHIYSLLSNHPSVEEYPNVRGASTNLFFIKHNFEEDEDEHLMSHSNDHEASYMVSLCRYFLQQRYTPDQITILVTYSGQLLAMRRLMPKTEFNGVIIRTVDNFQGEENDIILLSLVRSNSEKSVGFLKEENRVCVALSRARQGFYCIGNFDMLREEVFLWDSIITDMEQKGKVGDGLLLHCSNHPETSFLANARKDFDENAPKGGCLLDCTLRLRCGHVCTQKCHYSNPEHAGYKCKKKCSKCCPEGHPCDRLCYEECKCMVRVMRELPGCKHTQEMYCHENPALVNCISPCKNKCSKQLHECPFLCYQGCQPCRIKVRIVMPSCQHEQWVECHYDTSAIVCKAECVRQCKNGHKCTKFCHEAYGNCSVPTKKSIPECGHEVTLPCYIEPQHSECTKPCEKKLPCGHKCQLTCGEDCCSNSCNYQVFRELPSCGHRVKVACSLSESLETISCNEQCDRLLPCGHPCDLMCSDPCKTECKIKVNKKWPCGHKLKRPCYQIETPENYPCRKKCEKLLECMHRCSKKCGQPCNEKKCKEFVQKKYPCGHFVQTPCSSTPSEFPCNWICYVLACGHKCDGKCSECFSRHMHEPCRFKIGLKRFCGHSFQTPCSGLRDSHPGKKDITVLCSHETATKKCSKEILHACEKICEWSCAHFSCSKPCMEMCDRPKCDERCPEKLLKCGHRCYGLCGEPCLSVCPECHPETFLKKLKRADEFSNDCLYYELPCKHIFPVHYLDEYVQQLINPQSHILVCPIQCPVKECSQPLSCSYRYGNAVKKFLSYMQDVNDNLNNGMNFGNKLLYQIQTIIESDHCTSLPEIGRKKRGRPLIKFKLMPEISSALSKLKPFIPRHSEEHYLVLLFIEGIDILILLQDSSASLSSIADYDTTVATVKSFLQFGSSLIGQEFKVTFQIITDLRCELIRLFLCVHILLAKSEPLSDGTSLLLSEAETYLNDMIEFNESTLLLHLKALCEATHRASLYEELKSNLELHYPKFEKGKWWRCPLGHYYCSPLTLLEDVKLKCPRCEGSYENFIQLPNQEQIKESFPASTTFVQVTSDIKPQKEFDGEIEPPASHSGGQRKKKSGNRKGRSGKTNKKRGRKIDGRH